MASAEREVLLRLREIIVHRIQFILGSARIRGRELLNVDAVVNWMGVNKRKFVYLVFPEWENYVGDQLIGRVLLFF